MFREERWQPPPFQTVGWFGSAGLAESLLQLLEACVATIPLLTGIVSQKQEEKCHLPTGERDALCHSFM